MAKKYYGHHSGFAHQRETYRLATMQIEREHKVGITALHLFKQHSELSDWLYIEHYTANVVAGIEYRRSCETN